MNYVFLLEKHTLNIGLLVFEYIIRVRLSHYKEKQVYFEWT